MIKLRPISARPRPLLIACITAAMIRLLYLFEQSRTSVLFFQPTLDEQEMLLTAQALLRGEGFGPYPLFKAPFYPVVVAASQVFFGNTWFWGLRLIQHLGGVLLVAMGVDSAGRLTGGPDSRRNLAGLLTGMILAVYAPLIRLENRLILDFSVLFFQSAMLWSAIRWLTNEPPNNSGRGWLLSAGGFGALAWLTRPTITPVLPLFGLMLIALKPSGKKIGPESLRIAALFFALPVLAMTSVVIRNATVGGDPMLLPWQGGYNLYHANRSGASGRYFVQEAFADSSTGNPTATLMIQGLRRAVQAGDHPAVENDSLYRAVNHYWTHRLLEDLRNSPGEWLTLMMRKGLYLFSDREIFNFEDFDLQRSEAPILRALPISFGWIWPLALASLALPLCADPPGKRVQGLLWGYLLFMGGAIALVYVSGRLRMPLVFPVALLAGGTLTELLNRLQHRSTWGLKTAGLTLALFSLGLLISWGDWWGVRTEQVAHHDLARMSGAAWREGQYERALDYALRAEELMQDSPRIPLLKAQAHFSLGQIDASETLFLEAMRLQPGDATPAFNLGVISYEVHQNPERALLFFQEALRRSPGHETTLSYLALCHLQLENLEAAEAAIQPLIKNDNPQPALRTRIAVYAVLKAQGKKTEARDYYATWIAPLNKALLEEVHSELKKLPQKTKIQID